MKTPMLQRASLVLALTAPVLSQCRERTPPPRASHPAATPMVDSVSAARDDHALSASAATALAGTFQRAGATVTLDDVTVHVDSHTLQLGATVQDVREGAQETTAQIEVSVAVDGHPVPAFRSTSVAIDANRTEAVERAVREWNVGMATPIVAAFLAVYGTGDAGPGPVVGTAGLSLGTYAVFPGPTGIRGEEPDGLHRGSVDMHRAILGQIFPGLAEVIPPDEATRFRSLRLALHVHNGHTDVGDCRADGALDGRLCELMRGYAWPSGTSDFLFKQFYVLVRTR